MELQRIDGLNEDQKKKLILQKFYENVRLKLQMKKLFFKLSNNGEAALFSLFDKWKMLPDVKAKQHETLMNKCVNDLERGLARLVGKQMKKVFTPLRDDLLEGQAKQRGALKALVDSQKSDLQRKFDTWKNQCVHERNLNKVQ